ncbi:hypothetical protein H8E77_09110 [bacterium]|nr:hypothetical protein [bacterium]
MQTIVEVVLKDRTRQEILTQSREHSICKVTIQVFLTPTSNDGKDGWLLGWKDG